MRISTDAVWYTLINAERQEFASVHTRRVNKVLWSKTAGSEGVRFAGDELTGYKINYKNIKLQYPFLFWKKRVQKLNRETVFIIWRQHMCWHPGSALIEFPQHISFTRVSFRRNGHGRSVCCRYMGGLYPTCFIIHRHSNVWMEMGFLNTSHSQSATKIRV